MKLKREPSTRGYRLSISKVWVSYFPEMRLKTSSLGQMRWLTDTQMW
jgi:hypothetical protein